MTLKLRLILAGVLALVCIWLVVDVHSCVGRHQESARLQKANQLEQSQTTHGTEATVHEQEAQALTPALQQDAATDAGDDAAVERDRAALQKFGARPRPVGPAAPADPAQPVSAPVDMAALDAVKDQLIADLTKDLTDTKKALVDTRAQATAYAAGDQARQAQVQDLQGEVGQLRAIIAARPTVRTWTVGAVYGTNQTVGGYISKDLGLVQVGVNVVRRQLAGGQTTLEAIGTAGVRF